MKKENRSNYDTYATIVIIAIFTIALIGPLIEQGRILTAVIVISIPAIFVINGSKKE